MKTQIIMKTLKFLTFTCITLVMVFTSCSKDDVAEPVSIIETWKLASATFENNHDINGDGTSSNDLIGETNCFSDETLIFKNDGTGTQEIKEFTLISYDEVTDLYTIDCLPPSSVGVNDLIELTWTQNNNTRTFIVNGASYTGTASGSQLTIIIPNGFPIADGVGQLYSQEDLTLVYNLQ